MNTIKHLMRSSGFQGRVFPFSPMYSIWEIDEIIRGELYRNICMASLAITIATIFLLSDLVSACFVILCVFLTLTNVSGIMYFWGKFQLFLLFLIYLIRPFPLFKKLWGKFQLLDTNICTRQKS
jgi:hypothetical protein